MRFRYDPALILLLAPILAGCADDGPARSSPEVQPRLLGQWGSVTTRFNPAGTADMVLTPDGASLYIVPVNENSSSLVHVDRRSGIVSRRAPVASRNHSISAIDVSPDGEIFVAIDALSRWVVVFDHNLREQEAWQISPDPAEPGGRLSDVAYNPISREVVVVDGSGDRILRYTLGGEPLSSVRSEAVGDADWFQRAGLLVLPSGEMLIGYQSIHRVSIDATYLGSWPATGTPLPAPVLGAVRDGFVYVGNRATSTIDRYDLEGGGRTPVGPTEQNRRARDIETILVSPEGDFLIGDRAYPGVFEYGPGRDLKRTVLLATVPPSAAAYPRDLVVGPSGQVLVTDALLRRVVRSTSSSGVTAAWGSPDLDESPLIDPQGVALLSDGRIMVSDRALDELRTYDAGGYLQTTEELRYGAKLLATDTHLFSIGGSSVARRGLDDATPESWGRVQLAGDGDYYSIVSGDVGPGQNLYLLTNSPWQVLVVNEKIRIIDRIDVDAVARAIDVVDIAVDEDGWIYLVGAKGAVLVLDEAGAVRAQWTDDCSMCSPGIVAIDVGPDRSIYVARAGRPYQRFEPIYKAMARDLGNE